MHINDPISTFEAMKKNGATRNDMINPENPHEFTQTQKMSKSNHNQTWDTIRNKPKHFSLVKKRNVQNESKGNIFESTPKTAQLSGNSEKVNGQSKDKINTLTEQKCQKKRLSQVFYSSVNSYHDYENTEAQEEAIYQNLIFSNGKSFPETKRCHENTPIHSLRKSRSSQVFEKMRPKSNKLQQTCVDAENSLSRNTSGAICGSDKLKVTS